MGGDQGGEKGEKERLQELTEGENGGYCRKRARSQGDVGGKSRAKKPNENSKGKQVAQKTLGAPLKRGGKKSRKERGEGYKT